MSDAPINQATDLTDFVERDLRARFASGRGAPCKLTLAAISAHYGVSMTPIRIAVANLIGEGVLEKLDNGQLSAKAAPKRVGRVKAVRPPPSADDRDRALLGEVMMASLEPEAIFLREEAMAAKCEVGRSVIRQALGRLASPGLLEHIPRRGWRVDPINHEKARSFLQIREALELTALDLARPRFEESELRGLRGLYDDVEGRQTWGDNQPHDYWIERSGNLYIQDFFRRPAARYHAMLFNHAAPRIEVVAEMTEQHRGILDALLADEWTEARRRLSEHIWTQERVLLDFISRPGE